MNNIIEQMLDKYEIRNDNDKLNAMKEIIQEIVLSGLSRGNFFNEATFYGGTCLRIFYGLDRFSEDLDFALLEPNAHFDLSKYFKFIEDEAKSYGLNISISTKQKTRDSNITSAFLKGDTVEHILKFFPQDGIVQSTGPIANIKIKFEVDINPPAGAIYDFKYQLLPSPYEIRLYDKSSLFAGKIHAILCRAWVNRVKGRDLYDYIHFLKMNTSVNLELLRNKLIDSKFITSDDPFDIDILKIMLKNKFKEIDYNNAKEDVKGFIKNVSSLDVWNSEFFTTITDNLK